MTKVTKSATINRMDRRKFLATTSSLLVPAMAQSQPTKFQLGCMTLPYSAFTFERALTGIKNAGYEYVAWGVEHQKKPALALQASAQESRNQAERCRSMGLEPIMMFSTVFLEEKTALDAHLRRIEQAQAAGIPYLLTFGRTRPGEYETFVQNLKQMAPVAKKAGVMVVVKQHGGNTATGEMCAKIVREVSHESVKICYDAGNVLDYENHDPIADIQTCWPEIRAFNIKDHRNTPKDEDCGPGFGEIDHYKLFTPVMKTGLTIPLTFENIFEPLVPRPSTPEAIDILARRAREYVESVLRGLQSYGA